MSIGTIFYMTLGIAMGFILGLSVMSMPKIDPLPCPNGAVGQLVNPDGTTYCSYISGRYRPVAKWERN